MRVPPKRPQPQSLRRMFAPADVTETARQGQGIGDVEAMRQMAVTAVPEILRNLPGTSTPMSALDAALAVGRKDYPGAAMAALGAVPFAGALKYADEARDAARAVRSALPMDEASRMARAAEQGFTNKVYHGTGFSGNMEEITPSARGFVGPGVYTTRNPSSASDYAIGNAEYMAMRGEPYAPNVLPLLTSVKNPLRVRDREEYWDVVNTLLPNRRPGMGLPKSQAEQLDDAKEITSALKKAGYDGVLWGDEVVVPLESSQVRSRFAKFDPANIGKAGLMGGIAAVLAGQRNQEQRDEP